MNTPRLLYLILSVSTYLCLASCNISQRISRQATSMLLKDTAISKGFIGVSIFDAGNNKFLYQYNADKYFVPASNTKLFTLYAGMKYCPDSLNGLKYLVKEDTVYAWPTADPSFLYQDFTKHPVADFFRSIKSPVVLDESKWHTNKYGMGWVWDDYDQPYMPERSPMPVGGNNLNFHLIYEPPNELNAGAVAFRLEMFPQLDNAIVNFLPDSNLSSVTITRADRENNFTVRFPNKKIDEHIYVPYVTNELQNAVEILRTNNPGLKLKVNNGPLSAESDRVIKSQLKDSLFKSMMHRSDNFFAEQTLLMASNEFLGIMNEKAIIDTLLKTFLSSAPQKPKWVDGSGLSRYNLFSPADFIYILNKLKNDYGLNRLQHILATGGEGTLRNYYLKDSGYIFAKTGTLSNNCALSGYLVTKKNKLLLFSVLVNNYQTAATPVRRAVELFIHYLREKY